MKRGTFVVFCLALLLSAADGFVATQAGNQIRTLTDVSLNAKMSIEELELQYGEQSRPFRRDFFSHEKWVKHRAPYRFTRNLANILKSGVVRSLAKEIFLISSVATFLVGWNALFVAGLDDFAGVHHAPLIPLNVPLLKLPLEPFTLSSPALSLLLVFRTNSSYKRWDEARKAWGVIVNNSRTIVRQTAVWLMQADIPAEEKQRLMKRVADAVWLFPRAEMRHLLSPREDEKSYVNDVRTRLPPPLAESMISFKRHRPSRALYEMTNAINDLPIEFFRRVNIDESVSHLCDAMGGCDRIFSSPIPLVYTRHTARFLELWLLGIPLALYQPLAGSWNHILLIPVSAVISFFLLGIEELSIQLEEPFSVLPLANIAGGIGKSADEHVEWLDEVMDRNGELQKAQQPQMQDFL